MQKNCSRCNEIFECKHNDIINCQCGNIQLNDEERNFIAAHYQDCLCINCLKELQDGSNEVKH